MAVSVRKVNYSYLVLQSRVGQGAKVLAAIQDAGIELLGVSGFPVPGGKAQIDLVVRDVAALRRMAARKRWKLSPTKRCFLFEGEGEIGALQGCLQNLADRGIGVIAADAVSAGAGRFGMLLWVKPVDYPRAAKALGAQ